MTEKRRRGFAGMDQAKQREIASKGGKAAHRKGTAHEFTTEEARIAGRKGGQAAHMKGTAHQFTPEEARAAGRKGGQAASDRNRMRAKNAGPQGSQLPREEPTANAEASTLGNQAMPNPQPQTNPGGPHGWTENPNQMAGNRSYA